MHHITKVLKAAIYLGLTQPFIRSLKSLKASIRWRDGKSLLGSGQIPRIYFNNFL